MRSRARRGGARHLARASQGAAGALLVPGSLAIIGASFHDADRGRAIGAWSGLAGISGAVGPFLGGWLIDTFSWRWVFLMNVPLAIIAVAITLRHVPESRATTDQPIDGWGAFLAALGLDRGVLGVDRERQRRRRRGRSSRA